MADRGDALGQVLSDLWATVGDRAAADPGSSYTARLLSAGVPRAAQKVGEEATETVIAAVGGDARAAASESADLLYHLLVLWRAAGVEPDDVAAELRRRERPAEGAGE